MKKEELTALRKELLKEKIRNERIVALESKHDVIEYMNLLKIRKFKVLSDKEILEKILEKYQLTATNNIWVLAGTFKTELAKYEEDTYTYRVMVNINDTDADFRDYINIESLDSKKVLFHSRDLDVEEFQSSNIVLNPFDGALDGNGVNKVRNDFILRAINSDEEKAKEYILKKYKRVR